MIRRLVQMLLRREPDLSSALRRALAREEARGGGVVAVPAAAGEVPDAVDQRWRELNALDLTGRATPAPSVPIPTDEAVQNAGHLPMTWRDRRHLDDAFARITNCPEAIR